jgi:hypothetical protein
MRMAKKLNNNVLNIPEEREKIDLSENQLREINSSRLEIAAGHFIENKIFQKELILWLKNR